MKEIKLHLGCGDQHLPGFINVDIRNTSAVDVVDDVRTLEGFSDVSLIYASHVLEHFPRHEYMNVLQRWYDVLRDDGILRLSVPDFGSIVAHYNNNGDVKQLIGLLYGGQNYEFNFHHMAWDFQSLSNDLLSVGFSTVFRYDWRMTDHNSIDDFSQAYLPHMDKDEGMLMSLNVEATK